MRSTRVATVPRLPLPRAAHPRRLRQPGVARRGRERATHRGVERVRARQRRARRRNAVGRLCRRQERGSTARRRGDVVGRSGDGEGLHAEVAVDRRAEVAHRLGPVGKDGGEVGPHRPERRRAGRVGGPDRLVGRLLDDPVERDLEAGPVLRLDHVHQRRDEVAVALDCSATTPPCAASAGRRWRRSPATAVRPASGHRRGAPEDPHRPEHNERAGRRATARATAGPTGRHRRRNLLRQRCDYSARNEESPDSPAVESVLALERHCTVGAMARTSTRSRWCSTSSRISPMTSSVRRWGCSPRSSSLVLAAWK